MAHAWIISGHTSYIWQKRLKPRDKEDIEDITLVNISTPYIGTPKYVKQILLDIKGEIDRSTVIVGDFNAPLISMDRSSRQKISKETVALNDTLDQMDLILIPSEHFTRKQQNVHTFQVHMECFLS